MQKHRNVCCSTQFGSEVAKIIGHDHLAVGAARTEQNDIDKAWALIKGAGEMPW